jgi:hypothetical protein
MGNRIETRPSPGKSRINSLFDRVPKGYRKETTSQNRLTFSEEDLYFLATLMVSTAGISVLKSLGVLLDPKIKREIENYQTSAEIILKERSISLEKYFTGDANNPKGPLKILEVKFNTFDKMTANQRQSVLKADPETNLVLGPLADLAKNEVGFWLRIAQSKHLSISSL